MKAILLSFAVFVVLLAVSTATPANYNYTTCKVQYQTKWMQSMSSVLGPKTMLQIVVPGTHDSGSFSLSDEPAADSVASFDSIKGYFGDFAVPVIKDWSETQGLNFNGQLGIGARYFDLRVTYTGSDFYLYHFLITDYNVDTALQQFKNFILQNTQEIIFLNFNHLLNLNTTQHHQMFTKINNYFGGYLLPVSMGLNLTYSQMVSSRYRVVAFYEGLFRITRNETNIFDGAAAFGAYANSNDVTVVLNTELSYAATYTRSALNGTFFYPQFVLTATDSDIQNSVEDSLKNPLSDSGDLRSFVRAINAKFGEFYSRISVYDFRVIYVDFIEETNSLNLAKTLNLKSVVTNKALPGSVCAQDADCYFGNCQTTLGFCLVDCPQNNGSSCGDKTQCTSGICNSFTCAGVRVDSWVTLVDITVKYLLSFLA